MVPRAAAAVANSEPAAERFLELGFPRDRVFRALHSTNIAPFRAVGTERVVGPAGGLRILATGRLIPRKGFDRLVRAFALARAQRPGITLKFVGSGPAAAALRALAADLGVPVEFGGFVDQDGLPGVYGDADAYAFPSLDDPFGIVVLEAAATALPIVASPLAGATHDVLVDEVSGIVCHPDDLDGWAKALVRLTDDPELRERLGRAAYDATESRTPENAAKGYADAVEATLASPKLRV